MNSWICEECNQENTGDYYWCRSCNAKRFQQNFKNWTSGNDVKRRYVVEFIKLKDSAYTLYKIQNDIKRRKKNNLV